MKNINKSVMIPIILMILISIACLFKIKVGGERVEIASFTLIIGIVAFYITRKTNDDKNEGLNHKTILNSLKKVNIIVLILMPTIMNVICLLLAKLCVPEFVEHLTARTDFLSFNKVLILVQRIINN